VKRFIALVVAVFLGQAGAADAQIVTGSVEGYVFDDRKQPVASATIVVSGPALQGTRGAVSTATGYFALPQLPPGTYTVAISHVSYQALTVDDVAVRLGRTTTLRGISLTPALYEAPAIVVKETRPPVDVTSTDVGGNLTIKQLNDLPTGRDYRTAIAFLPQANGSFYGDATNIAGSTGSESAYFIDGVNVTDPYLAFESTRLPMNFVKELQLVSAGYQAQYGRSHGGVVNVITQSGSNEFRGRGFGFYTDNDFAGDVQRGATQLGLEGFARYDAGVTVSGPIAKDELWYFAAYNPTVQREDLSIGDFGTFRDERNIHQFAGKVSWRANESTNLNLVAFGDPTTRDRVGPDMLGFTPTSVANPDPLLSTLESGGTTISLDGQHFSGDRFLFDFSVYRLDTRQKAEPSTEVGWNEPLLTNFQTGVWSGGNQNIYDNRSTRWAARLIGTAYLSGYDGDTHEIKVGIEYEDNRLDTSWQWLTPDGRDGWVIQLGDSFFVSNRFIQDVELSVRVPSVFVQDSWQASKRLRVNLGVRWDGYYSVDNNGDIVEQINDQYQPRLGAVYQIGEPGTQKVYASVGRFYEQIPTMPGRFLSGFFQSQTRYDVNPITNPGAVPIASWTILGDLPADDLKGQHFDEVVLGYERVIGSSWRAGISGIHREQREVVDDAAVDGINDNPWQRGNPGRGELDFLSDPVRRYSAIELTVNNNTPAYSFGASYVLSRSYGNYVGVYNQDYGFTNANTGPAFTIPLLMEDAEGLLPNDRPNVFKIFGSYATSFGLGMGAFFTWQTGTPLSEFGLYDGSIFRQVNLRPRGTWGRAPDIWDLNLRFAYDLGGRIGAGRFAPRLLLDVFHAFSQEEPVAFDQVHYFAVDENRVPAPGSVNPFFMQPTAYQPPMAIRAGLEVGF